MYHFIFETPKPTLTDSSADRRRAELKISDAKSHAAKFAYLKKVAKERLTKAKSRSQLIQGNADVRTKSDEAADDAECLKPCCRRDPSRSSGRGKKERRVEKKPQIVPQSNGQRNSQPATKGNRVYSREKFKLEPNSLLAQTTKDPFDAFPERRLPANVEKVVQYAFDRIWPETLCAVRGQTLAVAKSEWKSHGLQDELLFHVQVALACGLNLALQTIPKVSDTLALVRLSHYSTAIRLLKQRIERLNGPASEDLIMSMLVLGVNADVEDAMAEAHPASPLATSQYMHLYGRLTLMPSYATALHQLVEGRGGMFELKHLAMADWLLLSDLHHASRTGDRLRYPPLRTYQSIVATGRHILDARAIEMSQTLGSGFDDLEKSLISPELDGAIAQGIEATVALDHYQRRENEQPLLVDVTLAANEAQRSFLEIEPRKGSGMDELVHECSRLTALIFCDMVLFPMPSCTKIKCRLASELRELLERSGKRTDIMEAFRRSTSLSELFLWVLVLAGIAASFTEHRLWFESLLRDALIESDKSLEDGEMKTWACFKRHEARFLWWDPVMDIPAMDLWRAVTIGTRSEVRESKNSRGDISFNENVRPCRCFICVQIDERDQ